MKTFTINKKEPFLCSWFDRTFLPKKLFLFVTIILLSGFALAQSTVTVSGASSTGSGANGTYYYTGTTNVDGNERRYYDQPSPSIYRIEYRYNTAYGLYEWEIWESTDLGGDGTVRYFNSSHDIIIPAGTWTPDIASGTPVVEYTLNSAPTDISLSATSINENVAGNSIIGTLSTTDADAGDTHVYSLVSGTGDTDNSSFSISGTNLLINNSPDFETKSSYSVRIQTDDGTDTYAKAFTINVNNIDPPTVTTAPASDIAAKSATLGGEVTNNGGAAITDYGVVYSTTDNTPSIAEGATKVSMGSGTGSFGSTVSGLSSNAAYYVSAYAINSEGTSYGSVENFTTSIETGSTGIEASKLICYPNPTKGRVFLIETDENADIKVYDVQSRLVLQTKGNQIDLSTLPNGIYLLDANGTKYKIIKK